MLKEINLTINKKLSPKESKKNLTLKSIVLILNKSHSKKTDKSIKLKKTAKNKKVILLKKKKNLRIL